MSFCPQALKAAGIFKWKTEQISNKSEKTCNKKSNSLYNYYINDRYVPVRNSYSVLSDESIETDGSCNNIQNGDSGLNLGDDKMWVKPILFRNVKTRYGNSYYTKLAAYNRDTKKSGLIVPYKSAERLIKKHYNGERDGFMGVKKNPDLNRIVRRSGVRLLTTCGHPGHYDETQFTTTSVFNTGSNGGFYQRLISPDLYRWFIGTGNEDYYEEAVPGLHGFLNGQNHNYLNGINPGEASNPGPNGMLMKIKKVKIKKNPNQKNSGKKNNAIHNGQGFAVKQKLPLSKFKGSNLIQLSPTDRQYLTSITNGFTSSAEGVRVPDMYPFPTITAHDLKDVTITSNATQFSFMVLPSPTLTIAMPIGSVAANGWGFALTSSGSTILGLTSDALLNAFSNTGRVVGMSCAIRNEMPFNTITGDIYVAPMVIPANSMKFNQTSITAMGAVQAVSQVYNNLTGSGNTSVTALGYPGCVNVSADELITKELIFSTRPVDYNGYGFRTWSINSVAGTNVEINYGDYVNTTLGVTSVIDTYPSQAADSGGMIGFLVVGQGLPSSTTTVNIEIKMHIEYQPQGTNSFVPTGSVKGTGVTVGMERLLSMVNVNELIKLVTPLAVKAGKGFLQRMAG